MTVRLQSHWSGQSSPLKGTAMDESRKQFEEWFEAQRVASWVVLHNDPRKEAPAHWNMANHHPMWKAWQAARSLTERSEPVAAERERCAGMAEDLAAMMENGAGECNPGERLRQCARNIRQAEKKPLGIAKFYPNSDTLASSPSGKPGGER